MKYLNLILLFFIVYATCYSQENIKPYLENVRRDFRNQEQIIPDSIVSENDIIFIGEVHGFKDNYEIAFAMVKDFKASTDFTYILGEMDLVTSQNLNRAILKEDTARLKMIVGDFKYSPAWCKEKYGFYKNIVELNKQYQNKIQFIGTDIPAGGICFTIDKLVAILNKYNEQDSILTSMAGSKRASSAEILYIKEQLLNVSPNHYNSDDLFQFKYHLNNIIQYDLALNSTSDLHWDRVRDSCMFENYKKLEANYQLKDHKMIGVCWGTTHVFQDKSGSVNWFASSLKKQLNKKIYSYRIFYFDSECMIPANWLPGLFKVFRSKKKIYYNTNMLNDDSWVANTILGIKTLKEVSPENTISVYDLAQNNSPYKSESFLVINKNTGWNTIEYFQSAIVIRNSLPTEPFGKNRK